jgi:hypothetical protein
MLVNFYKTTRRNNPEDSHKFIYVARIIEQDIVEYQNVS